MSKRFLTASEAFDRSQKTPRFARAEIDTAIRREAKKGKFLVVLRGKNIGIDVLEGLRNDGFEVSDLRSQGTVTIKWSDPQVSKE